MSVKILQSGWRFGFEKTAIKALPKIISASYQKALFLIKSL